jgi:hypothetical protein
MEDGMADVTTTDSTSGGTGIVDKVKQRAAEELSSQKDRAFEGIGSVAQAVRQSTHQLRDQQHDTLAGYVEQAADQIDRFARQLREKDVSELLSDAQNLARRQPALFVGSAFALGLLGARFFKSSTETSNHQSRGVSARRFSHSDSGGGTLRSASQYGGGSTSGTARATATAATASDGRSARPASGTSRGATAGTPLTSSPADADADAGAGRGPGSSVATNSTSGTPDPGTKATQSPAASSGRGRRSGGETETS